MKNSILTILLLFFLIPEIASQNIVKGTVLDSNSEKPLQGVKVRVMETTIAGLSQKDGSFMLKNIPNGNYLVELSFIGYETQNYPVELSGKTIDLGEILMYINIVDDQDPSTIIIADDELADDGNSADNISGLLQSSQDVYLRTAAFEFSSSFFRIRGLDSENGKVLMNGIEMNKLSNGRPQWNNWGGLNDVLRNQELSVGFSPSMYTFGGVLGATNFNTKASLQRPGTRISYASSNRSYGNRVMATHSTGVLKGDWAFTVSASHRFGDGFMDATSYDASSLFFAVEKKLSESHSLNFTSITAYNKRGRSAPVTQEVVDLKGIKYNSYWGYQEGEMRNSRVREVLEPIFILNHEWNINDKTTLITSVGYQFGRIGNSRIDNNGTKFDSNSVDGDGNPYIIDLGASNPDPTYYQKLPSYALRQDYPNVYEIQQEFLNNGQLDWTSLYRANTRDFNNGFSSYVLYEDRNDDTQFTANTVLNKEINQNITLNGRIQYTRLKSENFANVLDLLGGERYLDADPFAETFDQRQNDLLNPLNTVGVGDKFKYNFNLFTEVTDAFLQGQFKYRKVDFFVAGMVSNTAHQREGLFQNGGFADDNNSLGKSDKVSFLNYGAKVGFTYKLSGRHLFTLNGGYLTKAPYLRNTFSNSRENNNIVNKKVGNELVNDLKSERILSGDISYILRSPIVQAKVTGYYAKVEDATEISFFFADGVGVSSSENTAFVQEILKGVDRLHFGAELGIEAQVTPTIKLKAAANIGQYTYANNPNLYLQTEIQSTFINNTNSQIIDNSIFDENGRTRDFVSNLKNYKIASGPQTAYSIGFEYRDPEYWFVGATANFFDDVYVDVAPLTRTSNFLNDNGVVFNDYDPALARELLQQEQFENYMVVNLLGGKSWRINGHYISVFASVGNLFNTQYKSGGYEQGRNANFRQLKEDKSLDIPVFGNRYWFGRGTNYFLNLNYSF